MLPFDPLCAIGLCPYPIAALRQVDYATGAARPVPGASAICIADSVAIMIDVLPRLNLGAPEILRSGEQGSWQQDTAKQGKA